MANELAENRSSNRLPTLPGTGLPELSSTADISRLIARCLANYGERKGADMRLLAAEWHASLGAYKPDRLNAALTEHMRKSQFWPTIANFIEHLQQDTPPPGLPRYRDEEQGFCREGRTKVEEIAHRAAQCLKWRAEYGFNRMVGDGQPASKAQPASQSTTVSDALKATASYQRIKAREEAP